MRVLSCFSCVWLFATLWSIAHQAPLSMGSPGKDPGVGCHFLLQGSSQPGDRNPVSYVSCIGRQILYCQCLLGGSGTREWIAYIRWIMEKAKEFQKNIYFCFIDSAKASDCVDHNKLWKILKEMGVPDHLTCLQRNLFAGREARVRTRHGTTDWFQIGKGVSTSRLYTVTLLI